MALTAKRKAEIAAELRVASSWVGGPREAKLKALADEIEGNEPEEPTEPETAAKAESDKAKDKAK